MKYSEAVFFYRTVEIAVVMELDHELVSEYNLR